MVSFKVFLSALALQALAVASAPSQDYAGRGLEAREDTTDIFYCEHADWAGDCHHATVPLNKCHNVPAEWHNKISSIRNNDPTNYECTWFREQHCSGPSYTGQYDSNVGNDHNDKIRSYSCRLRH